MFRDVFSKDGLDPLDLAKSNIRLKPMGFSACAGPFVEKSPLGDG